MGIANAGHDGGAVFAIELLAAALGAVSTDGRQAPFDGRRRVRLNAPFRGPRCAGGDIDTDDFRIRAQGRNIVATVPGGLDINAGAIGQLFQESVGQPSPPAQGREDRSMYRDAGAACGPEPSPE